MTLSPSDVAALALDAFADGDAARLFHHATTASVERWSNAWRRRIDESAHPGGPRHPPEMPLPVQAYHEEQWTMMVARDVEHMRGTFGHVGPLETLLELSDAALLSKAWRRIPAAHRASRVLTGDIRDGEQSAYVLTALALRHESEGPAVLPLTQRDGEWRIVLERQALYALAGLAGRTYNGVWLAPDTDAAS
jgi:hypothetical protein